MKLTVVGCASAYTRRPGQASSCYLVEHEGRAVLLDMGQGSFAELARYRAAEELGGVLVSHLHADHLVDLIPLRHYLRYEASLDGRVRLHGPAELRLRFEQFQAEAGFMDPLPGDGLEPGVFELAGLRVEARHVTHIEDSYAFRLTPAGGPDRPGLVYSGDCARADDLLPLLHEGDTLLCEAAFGAGPGGGGGHLTAQEAARVAAQGGVARLVLTHILDRHDSEAAKRAAEDRLGREVLLAQPGLTLDVG
ncbi:MAG TPA: MBL fold metallo-hydrolase [Candidatus Limnocylindria bacterium]|nr:MBL fold metallo-hydrolase [Candidatus Limnocylindria bacterium]